MTARFWTYSLRAAALTLLVGTMLSTAAVAQRPSPPPGGPFGGPGGMGRGMRGPRPSTLANTPLAALSAGLKLTSTQKSKIAAIQSEFRRRRQEQRPRPGGPPPPREAMHSGMDRMRGLDEKANNQIQAVLTSSQKAALPTLLKTFDDLRFAGIPLETYGTLNLRADQKVRIAALAQTGQQNLRKTMDRARQSGDFGAIREAMQASRDQMTEKAANVLTSTQKTVVNRYKASHPRPDRPGGGFGPPPPGGGGFGPPPPGGEGGFGPPPPDEP